jgi:aspartate aminotransferase
MFESIQALPPDPILGISGAFSQDPNPRKIDLGAGVYRDETGNTPIFRAVKEAESRWFGLENTKVYIPPAGYPDFNAAMIPHVFGEEHPAVAGRRIGSVMTPGGCGALRVGAELINRFRPGATLWVSAPTWANHVPLLGGAGLQIREYPYYDPETQGLDAEAMLEVIGRAGRDDVVLLHGCCHNPSGVDLRREHWDAIAELAGRQGFLPYIDLAYHGFGYGLDADAYGPRRLAESLPEVVVTYSCSKNFGLYRERAGALMVVGREPAHAEAAITHINQIARGMYSMSPSHGGAIVKTILGDAELYRQWREEVDAVRRHINDMRALLADTLEKKKAPRDFSFIKSQRGMFSFLGISKELVQRLRKEFSVYLVDSSRINIAGVSVKNADYLADAIISVL